jgi:hypothetical protein
MDKHRCRKKNIAARSGPRRIRPAKVAIATQTGGPALNYSSNDNNPAFPPMAAVLMLIVRSVAKRCR